jgi:Ubinuclein conserved middle domain
MSSTLEGSASLVSEQGLRKALYQKIVAAFPEGWMSSGQVSREGELHVRRRSLAAR